MRQQPVSGTKQWISGFFFACGFMKLEVSAGKSSDFVNSVAGLNCLSYRVVLTYLILLIIGLVKH